MGSNLKAAAIISGMEGTYVIKYIGKSRNLYPGDTEIYSAAGNMKWLHIGLCVAIHGHCMIRISDFFELDFLPL